MIGCCLKPINFAALTLVQSPDLSMLLPLTPDNPDDTSISSRLLVFVPFAALSVRVPLLPASVLHSYSVHPLFFGSCPRLFQCVSVLHSLSFFLSSCFSTSCATSKTTLSRSTRLHRSLTFTQQQHPRVSTVSTPHLLSYCALTNFPHTSSSWRQSITAGSPPLMLSLETSQSRHPS